MITVFVVVMACVFGALIPRRVLPVFGVCVFARFLVALLNVNVGGTLIGADSDAQNFIFGIMYCANNVERISWNIESLLGGNQTFINLYSLPMAALGDVSSMAAHSISVAGGILCLFLLVRCYQLFLPTDYSGCAFLLLVYTFSPSVLTCQSYVLREAWQSAAMLGVVWSSLLWYKNGMSIGIVVSMVVFSLLGSLLHHALPVVFAAIAFLVVSSICIIRCNSKRQDTSHVRVFVMGLLVLFVGFVLFMTNSDVVDSVANFQSGAMSASEESRAYYGVVGDLASPWTIPLSFLAYEVMPTPLHWNAPVDIVLSVENSIRVLSFVVSLIYLGKVNSNRRSWLALIVLIWITTEVVWSIGSVNWGTAARHHVMSYGLVLLTGCVAWRGRRVFNGSFASNLYLHATLTKDSGAACGIKSV